jgi:hypothetical protein
LALDSKRPLASGQSTGLSGRPGAQLAGDVKGQGGELGTRLQDGHGAEMGDGAPGSAPQVGEGVVGESGVPWAATGGEMDLSQHLGHSQ